jgi:hypothetical protein
VLSARYQLAHLASDFRALLTGVQLGSTTAALWTVVRIDDKFVHALFSNQRGPDLLFSVYHEVGCNFAFGEPLVTITGFW